jgi:hypothetical protein
LHAKRAFDRSQIAIELAAQVDQQKVVGKFQNGFRNVGSGGGQNARGQSYLLIQSVYDYRCKAERRPQVIGRTGNEKRPQRVLRPLKCL